MAATLVDLLQSRADERPDDLAYLFLIDGEQEGPRCTYAQLDTQARAIAAAVRRVIDEQERALLVYPPGVDFVAAFYGCLYAGVIAVPVYPPRPDFLRPGASPLATFAADCQPAAILGTAEMLQQLQPLLSSHALLSSIPALATDTGISSDRTSWQPAAIPPQRLAMLQYTSGSTTAPRGVMISHANLMHNEAQINTAFEHDGPGMGVGWLPPYHDMGLIGCILQALYHPAPYVMMSPISFLQQPRRWLAAVSKYRADTSGGPGFAFDLCVERIPPEQRKGLDLNQWSVAAIGSEPVRPDTLERFGEAFQPFGFRRETWYPCYGLAEGTVFVTGGHKYEEPYIRTFDRQTLAGGQAMPDSGERAVQLVGCGHTWGGQRLAIVDPESRRELSDGRVGEIWVCGPSVAQGYWGREEETRDTFQARLADTGEGSFLRTGDLGFVTDGQLFITGRLKDLIVLYGRNYAPHDIEQTVQSVSAVLRPECGAAFEVAADGPPRLVVVQEVDRRAGKIDARELLGLVREAVQAVHELHLHELVLVQPGSIPKTASGKVQRRACRAAYEADALNRWKGGRT